MPPAARPVLTTCAPVAVPVPVLHLYVREQRLPCSGRRGRGSRRRGPRQGGAGRAPVPRRVRWSESKRSHGNRRHLEQGLRRSGGAGRRRESWRRHFNGERKLGDTTASLRPVQLRLNTRESDPLRTGNRRIAYECLNARCGDDTGKRGRPVLHPRKSNHRTPAWPGWRPS